MHLFGNLLTILPIRNAARNRLCKNSMNGKIYAQDKKKEKKKKQNK